MRAPHGQVAVAGGVLAIGALILGGSFYLPTGGGYAQVGPGVVPRVVSVGLIILGALLLREAFTGGFRGVDEEAELHLPMNWKYFGFNRSTSGNICSKPLSLPGNSKGRPPSLPVMVVVTESLNSSERRSSVRAPEA